MKIDVHVQPRASRNAVLGWKDGALRVALTAPPVEGAANAALIEVLADALGLKKREIAVVAGQASRRKIIDKFWIDYGRCMRCNICVEVCNFDAISMNNTWEGHEKSVYDRADLVQDLPMLLSESRSGELKPWVNE